MHVRVLTLTSGRGCAAEARSPVPALSFATAPGMRGGSVLKTRTSGKPVFVKQSKNKRDTCFSVCPFNPLHLLPYHLGEVQVGNLSFSPLPATVATPVREKVLRLHCAEQIILSWYSQYVPTLKQHIPLQSHLMQHDFSFSCFFGFFYIYLSSFVSTSFM